MAGIIIDRFGIWNFYARSKIKGLIFEDALRNGALKSKATNQNNAYIYIILYICNLRRIGRTGTCTQV